MIVVEVVDEVDVMVVAGSAMGVDSLEHEVSSVSVTAATRAIRTTRMSVISVDAASGPTHGDVGFTLGLALGNGMALIGSIATPR